MIKEVDIAKPIEKFLEGLGYRVRSEVKSCDITALKDDELIVVECKVNFSIKLIYQAIERQEFSDNVYIALPIHSNKPLKNRRQLVKLLKRLELGLIYVHFLKTKTRVEVVIDPKEPVKRKKRKKREQMVKEIMERSTNDNVGGSVGVKLMTAYREASLDIAEKLYQEGPLTAKELKAKGTVDKTYRICYQNHYKWFLKEEGRGKFGLTERGKAALKNYNRIEDLG